MVMNEHPSATVWLIGVFNSLGVFGNNGALWHRGRSYIRFWIHTILAGKYIQCCFGSFHGVG